MPRLWLEEKGGKSHEMSIHHSLVEYMGAYKEVRGYDDEPMFLTINRTRTGYTENRLSCRVSIAMVKRRTKTAGLGGKFGKHIFCGTGIMVYLSNDGTFETAQYMAWAREP